MGNIASSLAKIKTEAERLEVMDTAASIMAEHLYTADLLAQVKEYRAIMLHVSAPSLPPSLTPFPVTFSPLPPHFSHTWLCYSLSLFLVCC